MAEKQLAYRVSGKDEFFADDDPLAELARIVGFDTRPAAPVAANQRQEPAFDLEDELLREFERYDAPRGAPVAAVPPAAEFTPHLSSVTEDAEPEYADYAPPESEPAPIASHLDSWQQEQDHAPAVHQVDAASWNPAEESWDLSSAAAPEPFMQETFAVSAPVVETGGLEDELELSIGSAPVVPPAAKTPQWAAASIRLPLANFNAQHREQLAPPVAAPVEPVFDIAPPAPVADFETPSLLGFPTEQDRHELPAPEAPFAHLQADPVIPEFDLTAAARDGTIEPDAALTEPAYAPAAGLSAMDIDDLLADVSRYPVPAREAAARMEPTISFAREPVQTQPAALPVDAFIMQPAAVHQPAVAEHLAEEIDPFDDHEFDLDLADIELELAELDLAEADTASHHQNASPVVDTSSDDDWLYETPETATAYESPVVAAAYAVEPAALETESFVEEEQELPFDPSEISDTEDRIETFEDMHVPVLPPVEQEEPVAAAPDYDFDIDAEMANLFSPAPLEPAVEPSRAAPIGEAVFAQAAAASVRSAAPRAAEGLDEFERALEEDFRRSFRESPGPTENVSQMMFESSSITNDRWRARSMRGFAIAAAAVVVVGAGAYGVYGWMSHGGSSLGFTSGEPRVIVADKDPVKVVPEDPGGKIVPNQDKAVYDRVAGDAAQAPKQKELVTSNEQPVDVVQKTLIPEAVSPDDSEGDPNAGAPTPVGETEDPRLLPNQGNGTAAAAPQDGVPSVSPRKVRTMIVKPDGTLVPREEDAPVAGDTPKVTTPAPALATPTKPAANGKPTANTQVASATPAVASDADGNAASAESAPIRVVKTTNLANAPVAAAPAAAAPDAATAVPTARPTPPAAAVTPPAPTKPVVAAKPPVAPKPAPIQVAAATPAPQPVKAVTTAAAASASPGGYVMQIASLPSEEEAKRSQANLSAKFGSVIGGHPIEVRKVDIAGKGTYYRVRVAVGSKDDAADLCVKLRAAGGTCLISK